MTLLDRHILLRFLANFVILFALLFMFAVAVDLIVALDSFVATAHRIAGPEAGAATFAITLVGLALDFEGPRLFQFYAYLHGLVAVGAMGFTLAQMHRARELVAILAAGIGLPRVAMPFVVGAFTLSVVQLVNQEVFLPRVAPLLLRDHGQLGRRGVDEFPVALTPDARGSLFQSPKFDPRTSTFSDVTILERDERGRTTRRVTATRATWSAERVDADPGGMDAALRERQLGMDAALRERQLGMDAALREKQLGMDAALREQQLGTDAALHEAHDATGWRLEDGRAVRLREAGVDDPAVEHRVEELAFYPTDLSPRALLVQRHAQFAGMLSLRQLGQMLATPDVENRARLLRFRYHRFATVLLDVLIMWLTLPTFLLREPASLLARTVLCAGLSIPTMLGAAIFMTMDLPGIAPAVGVFLPVIVLLPVVLAQWTYVKT
jgi:lipopolysaccharide export LptBFGC system permease protein LptF